MTDPNECNYCGKVFEPAEMEKWSSSKSDDYLILPRYDQVFALVSLAYGERYVCEDCFLNGTVELLDDMEFSELHYQFGLEYLQRKQYQQALDCFNMASQRVQSANNLVSLAIAHEHLNNVAYALEFLEKAREIEPDNPFVLGNLPRLYVKCHRYADAVAQVGSTLEKLADSNVVLDGAEALLRLGQSAKAEKEYQTALSIAVACCEDCRRECEDRWHSICAVPSD